jgi:hypothetical protein
MGLQELIGRTTEEFRHNNLHLFNLFKDISIILSDSAPMAMKEMLGLKPWKRFGPTEMMLNLPLHELDASGWRKRLAELKIPNQLFTEFLGLSVVVLAADPLMRRRLGGKALVQKRKLVSFHRKWTLREQRAMLRRNLKSGLPFFAATIVLFVLIPDKLLFGIVELGISISVILTMLGVNQLANLLTRFYGYRRKESSEAHAPRGGSITHLKLMPFLAHTAIRPFPLVYHSSPGLALQHFMLDDLVVLGEEYNSLLFEKLRKIRTDFLSGLSVRPVGRISVPKPFWGVCSLLWQREIDKTQESFNRQIPFGISSAILLSGIPLFLSPVPTPPIVPVLFVVGAGLLSMLSSVLYLKKMMTYIRVLRLRVMIGWMSTRLLVVPLVYASFLLTSLMFSISVLPMSRLGFAISVYDLAVVTVILFAASATMGIAVPIVLWWAANVSLLYLISMLVTSLFVFLIPELFLSGMISTPFPSLVASIIMFALVWILSEPIKLILEELKKEFRCPYPDCDAKLARGFHCSRCHRRVRCGYCEAVMNVDEEYCPICGGQYSAAGLAPTD